MEAVDISMNTIILLIVLFGSATSDGSRDNLPNEMQPSFHPLPSLEWPDKPIAAPGSIRLLCFIQSTSPFSMEWTKDGVLMTNSTVSILNSNQTLRVDKTRAEDTGIYFCKGCNSAGCIHYTQYIKVTESWTSPPLITDLQPPGGVAFVELGYSVNISCTFSSGDICFTQTADWFRDGQRLNDSERVNKGINNDCDNGTKTLILSLQNITVKDLGPYTCFGKNYKSNSSKVISLKLLNPAEKDQAKRKALALTVALSVGGVVVGTLLVLIVVRKRCRKTEYKMLDWQQPDLGNFEIPNPELAYDVFLSYSSADLDWVQPVLFQRLRESGYQVCADFKDFTPGAAVVENILDAIYKSKRTLIVMSQCFLRSVWTKFELDHALYRAMALRKDLIIMIKVDDCKVPANLLGITFLDWTDNKVKPHFWKRLYDAIGPPENFRTHTSPEEESKPEQPTKQTEIYNIAVTSENDTHNLIGQLITESTVPTNKFLETVYHQPLVA